jgi:2-methylcitrate dehydratase
MTLQRKLAWENIEADYQASIARKLARYALSLEYEMLPEEVVHQAKRILIDTLGCAIGAYEAPARQICEESVIELGGREEATLFGSGIRTNVLNATLYNGFLVRFLDYNDLGGGGHNSDAIPSILAVAEREKSSGQDFLTALVISYELGQRFADSVKGSSLQERGWCFDIRGGLSMPPTIGKLMGLTEEQIANAIGICASQSNPLNILDAHREEFVNAKNLRFSFVAYNAILSCILAKKGFTGPVRVVEGDSGLCQTILQGEMDYQRLLDFSGWRILDTRFKVLCTNGTNSGTVLATLSIVKEHDLKPEDILSVRIRTTPRQAQHTYHPAKKYPRNAETADHSTYYSNAFAIKERHFGPESIQPENFTDPTILELIEKITVEADPSLSGYQAISEITTKNGSHYIKQINTPHGLGNDPLTDEELEGKFRDMAIKYMDEEQIKKIFDTVWNIEKLDDMNELTRLMVFPKK